MKDVSVSALTALIVKTVKAVTILQCTYSATLNVECEYYIED